LPIEAAIVMKICVMDPDKDIEIHNDTSGTLSELTGSFLKQMIARKSCNC
jgi:hypothetical protein